MVKPLTLLILDFRVSCRMSGSILLCILLCLLYRSLFFHAESFSLYVFKVLIAKRVIKVASVLTCNELV